MRLRVLENPANCVARERTGRDYLSHTQVSTFQACPLRWHFHYVAGLQPERISAGLLFGGAIHAALEAHFTALRRGEAPLDADELLMVFDARWAASADVPIQYGARESADSLRRLAAGMLQAFLRSRDARPAGEIVGVEEEVRAPLIEGVPDLLARLDLVLRTDDALVIRDFKTARQRWRSGQAEEYGGQLMLYADLLDAVGLERRDRPVRMEFCVITKSPEPVIETFELQPDARARQRTRRIIAGAWRAMITGAVWPNPSPMNCAGCPYTGACRAWGG